MTVAIILAIAVPLILLAGIWLLDPPTEDLFVPQPPKAGNRPHLVICPRTDDCQRESHWQ